MELTWHFLLSNSPYSTHTHTHTLTAMGIKFKTVTETRARNQVEASQSDNASIEKTKRGQQMPEPFPNPFSHCVQYATVCNSMKKFKRKQNTLRRRRKKNERLSATQKQNLNRRWREIKSNTFHINLMKCIQIYDLLLFCNLIINTITTNTKTSLDFVWISVCHTIDSLTNGWQLR